ncbi:MAG: hypothetical protein RIT81_02620 [Deltaproteobacteria bacterium]
MPRKPLQILAVLLSSLGLSVGAGCGSRSIGEALMDAGAFLADAGANDAGAQSGSGAMLGDCSVEQSTRDVATNQVSIQRYAEFDVPGLQPSDAPVLSAFICGGIADPDNTVTAGGECPAGATCSGPINSSVCSPSSAYIADSKVYVYCGARSEYGNAGERIISGSRAAAVYLRIAS